MATTDAATGMPAVEMVEVSKAFGVVKALDELSLRVEHGEVHGFLGPNGAGKSTTIRILLGLLRADSGRASLLGGDPWSDAVALHRRLAYVPGDVALWPNLTGGEAVDLFARLRGGIDRARRDRLVDLFDLDLRKKGRSYSKGNRQKVALVSALSSRVDLLVLDEPTSGLDPLMESVFQECITEATREGTTVLLSSHILAQVEALADRISMVRKGRVVESGTLADMRHLSRTAISVVTDRPLDRLGERPGIHNVLVTGDRVRFDVDTAHLPQVMTDLAEHGVRSVTASPPTLEQILLRHYGDAPEETP